MIKSFDNNSLRNFSDVLAVILSHKEISIILAECSIPTRVRDKKRLEKVGNLVKNSYLYR